MLCYGSQIWATQLVTSIKPVERLLSQSYDIYNYKMQDDYLPKVIPQPNKKIMEHFT